MTPEQQIQPAAPTEEEDRAAAEATVDITDESWDALEEFDASMADERIGKTMLESGVVEEGIQDMPDSDRATDEVLG